jgi:hypothetical protein
MFIFLNTIFIIVDWLQRDVMSKKKLCTNCDIELDYDWLYCPYCGTKVT